VFGDVAGGEQGAAGELPPCAPPGAPPEDEDELDELLDDRREPWLELELDL
jgi:hypothetical protein